MSARIAVCILTAGSGSRMGHYCQFLNKSLLPLGKKAAISLLIDQFPKDIDFVIALGHKGEQVRTYLEMAHPDLNFQFVNVDKYSGEGSGPGYSTLCCREHLQRPFFYVSCDTLWSDAILPTDRNWFGVSQVDESERAAYCNFIVNKDFTISEIKDKADAPGADSFAFSGLAFIKSYEIFWQGLESKKSIAGEHQVSNGIQALVDNRAATALAISWIDIGSIKKYEKAVLQYEKYDFSKPDEALYVINGRVIKFFANESFAERRVAKAKLNRPVFPDVSEAKSGFYYYSFINGQSLYDSCNETIFNKLLPWLDKNLWKEVKVDPAQFQAACNSFYKDKTLDRLEKYYKKYPDYRLLNRVNGTDLRPFDELVKHLPWKTICDGRAVFFHGDFHFDHILYDAAADNFCLLDWRQDFGGNVEFGDLYYDLSKFYGGMNLNYDYIKAGMFTYSEQGNSCWLDYAQRARGSWYREKFEQFIRDKNLSVEKVRMLVPIIYLNMAPLHHYPFDKLLFALGHKTLQEELLAQKIIN